MTMREKIDRMNAVISNIQKPSHGNKGDPKYQKMPQILKKNMSQQKIVPKLNLIYKSHNNLK